MNTILEQIIQKIEMKKAATDNMITITNTNHKSVEVISTNESIYLADQLDKQNNDSICDTHGDIEAMKSRFHCLPLSYLNPIEDNGVAVLSPSVDITHDLISPLRSSHEAVSTNNQIGFSSEKELMQIDITCNTTNFVDKSIDDIYQNDILEGDMKSMKSRFHCLPLVLNKTIEDNGVAVLSPSADITHDLISPLRSSSEAIKTTDDINIENNEELIQTYKKDIYDVDLLSLRLAIETQNERLERLERAIERLVENGERSNTRPRSDINMIIQLYDQTPNKITIQYFLNTGKKIPPRVKLELRHKVRDINGKPYYPAYQTIYGNCYNDYGISKFDKFSKFSINNVLCDEMKPLREFISDARSALTETDDMIGTFFYDVDTTEIFLDAYVVINKTDGWGKLFLYNGNEFSEEAFEFATSKARAGSKCPDGIYTINHDKITNMLGL